MKVLFLTNIPAPYRVDFFNELGKYCELTVLFERRSASDRDKEWTADEANNFKAVFLKGYNIRNDSAICPSVVKWLDKKKFDIFVVGGYSTPTGMLAIQTLRMKKIPFFLNSDGGIVKKDLPLVAAIKRYFISSATWWLSTGNECNYYLEYYGAKPDGLYVYPFTSLHKSDLFEAPATTNEKIYLRKKLGIEGRKVAIAVGQFIHRKGFDILINAWTHVPEDMQLVIIGGGPDKQNYLELMESLEIKNIKLEEFMKRENLREYYRAADMFILPTREDIWGLVINESMSCGLPVISTDRCVAALELIGDKECGSIVPVNNVEELARTITTYFNDDEKLKRYSKNSIVAIRNYSIENMALEHIDVFNAALTI